LLCAGSCGAQELKSIHLPAPQTDGGQPLMQVLKKRATSREFSSKALPQQVLSNLLWAGFGINRPESGRRTAPSAVNWQETDIYVVLPEGAYLYNAKGNTLEPVVAGDLRPLTGTQDFVAQAPLNLVYVADFARMGNASPESKVFNSAADTGFISENVYLFCASDGLATVVRGSANKAKLAEALKLRPDQRVTLAQTVGYPK
jgi:nitroreductase